jgi:type II secretory pathway pseudopilin PulG
MNQKGQTLVEALVALGAAVVVVSAITVAVITAVSNSDFAEYQNLATGYAQQGIQIVQQKSQLDWAHTATYSGTGIWCLPQGTTDFYSHITDPNCSDNSVNIQDKFFRQVELISSAKCNNNIQAEVTVAWTDGKCSADPALSNYYCHNVTLDTCIADINRTQ